jgi:hypothetical protein
MNPSLAILTIAAKTLAAPINATVWSKFQVHIGSNSIFKAEATVLFG